LYGSDFLFSTFILKGSYTQIYMLFIKLVETSYWTIDLYK